MATKPWQPASVLAVKGKTPGMRYRWIRLDNLEKAMLEGWEPVKSTNQNKETAPVATLSDGTKIDGIIKKRNLVLCKTSEEIAQARHNYYQSKNEALLDSSVREFETAVGKKQAYGNIKVEKE